MEYFTFENGVKIPKLGFGVFQINDLKQTEETVEKAINKGYRLFDTAAAYGNESAVGLAINKSSIPREDFFITTKLWIQDYSYENAKKAIDNTLQKMQLEYLDLYLLHQPYGDVFGAWRALEEAHKNGKIRAIGVSNFEPFQLENLSLFNDIKPMVNQIEINPWEQNKKTVAYNQENGILSEAWAPFAEGKNNLFSNKSLQEIADVHSKNVGQVVLRWLLQRDIIVIPKTIHENRMIENINVFDFELTDSEMAQISDLDLKQSQFFDHQDPKAVQRLYNLPYSSVR
ncbi:aldo/keto reductase [Leuconostoc gasicomitatum]|uniref:Aldo/keto reductase n=1 Tax=Leuconostoc gasicomitatum TaxID=115778 RepID=A0A9Q3XVS9_9LACO|nr:aldo/keto reductase [Leuconostoc gasicomitatum]MBZ5962897.1 aldo/keto reductase [Leuconostoc gasicomitatum]